MDPVPAFGNSHQNNNLSTKETSSQGSTSFESMVDAPKTKVQTMLEAADTAAFAMDPDAESLYRAALSAANDTGDAAQQMEAWAAFGAYLRRRARNRPAVLAYASVWELAQKVEDTQWVKAGAYGIYLCLDELGDKLGALAAAKFYVGQQAESEWAQLPLQLQEQLQDPESILKASIDEIRHGLPDFERQFLAGEIRFDRPEDFLDLFTRRARHLQVSLLTTGQRNMRDAYRRQFLRRLIWPALPLIALGALYGLGWLPLGHWMVLTLVLLVVSIYVVFWISSVQSAWRWVSANRKLGSMDPRVTELIENSSTHTQAVSILERFAKQREPFVLYLRSFEGEASQWLTPEGVTQKGSSKQHFIQNAILSGSPTDGFIEATQSVISYQGGPSVLEHYLSKHLSKLIPVITIANPSASLGRSAVPRLEMEHNAWQRAVRLLMSAADFIVIEPSRSSAGVYQELELTKDSNRHPDTIVVLASENTRSEMEIVRKVMVSGFDQPVGPASKFLDANDEVLSGFLRIVEDDFFADRDPATLRVFRDVLPDGPATSPETYSERRRERHSLRSKGASLHVQGMEHLDRGEFKEANDLFQQAVDILGECGDLACQAMPLTYQGRAAQAMGDLDKAQSCFAAAVEIQRETGPPMEYIGSVHHLALLLLDQGNHDGARSSFEEMLGASRRWKFGRGEARAFEGLGMCAVAAGDREGAAEQLREALKLTTDPKGQASIAHMLSAVESALGDHGAAAEHSRVAANSFESIGQDEAHASALRNEIVATYNAAVRELEGGKVMSAVDKLNQALAASRELSLTDLQQTIMFRLGMAYSRGGQNGPAIDALRQSAVLARELDDAVQTALAKSNIGTLLVRDGRIPEGIQELKEAEELQRAQGSDGELAYTVDALGDAYFKQNQYDDSLVCDEESLRLHRLHDHPDRVIAVMERIGLARMYLGNYAEAKTILLEAANCAGEAGKKQQQATELALCAQLTVGLGDSIQASELFSQSIALWEELGDEEQAAAVRNLAQRNKGNESTE